MRKLSIGEKLTISNLLYVVPIIVLTYFMYDARTMDINFAEQEIVGNHLQTPVEKLLEAVSRHRIEAQRVLYGEEGELDIFQKRVEEALESVKSVYLLYAQRLKFTAEELKSRKSEAYSFENISKQWGELRSRALKMKAVESNDAHAALISSIRGMISYLGNSSNLILDPDLDTYYLADATLGGLPSLQDRIQDFIVFAEPIARTGKSTPEDRIKLAVTASQIKADLDRVTGDFQTVLSEDPNFYGTSESLQREIPNYSKTLSEDVGKVLTSIDELTKGIPVKTDAFLESSEKALNSSYLVWASAVPENNLLLKKRIDKFKEVRMRYVVLGFLVLLCAVLASFFVGRSLRNGLMSSLHDAVKELSASALSTTETGKNILINSEKLSEAAIQQAAALQETVSALTEINAMVGKSRDNATHSVVVVGKSQESAVKGKKAVDNMVIAIGEISDSNELILKQTEESNRKIEDIVRVINEIGTKTKVINDIVFQTKLLSFNASVEAARAGEHGKGFAVVAEEVGNLAQMSGNAAKEISDMLSTSTQTVATIVSDTKSRIESLVSQAKNKVEEGKKTANYCGEVLNNIVGSVEEVTNLVNEIATAATEQARGVDEITKAMHQLDEVTQTNTRMSGETNTHASSLAEQAENLQRVVKKIENEVIGASQNSKISKGSNQGKDENVTNIVPIIENKQAERKKITNGNRVSGEEIPAEDDPRFEDA